MQDTSRVEPPLVVDNADTVKWDAEADLLVVGFGAAGACASLQAREGGASVIAIDRFDGGGATAYSGGVVYGGNTRFQQAGGIKDSAEEMYKYLSLELQDAIKPETLRRFCQGSSADIDWLAHHGVPFGSVPHFKKCALPPPGKDLYFAGNENLPGFKERAIPAPRGHRTMGIGWTGGIFYAALRAAALRAGVEYRPFCRATRLITDMNGTVVGVEVSEIPPDRSLRSKHLNLYGKVMPTKPFNNVKAEASITKCRIFEDKYSCSKLIRGRSGIILASGGFIYNLPMLTSNAPHLSRHAMMLVRAGSMGCDGSGIRLGCSAGAATAFMDNPTISRVITPPAALVNGIIVNQAGARFATEEAYSSTLGKAISQQRSGVAWLIVTRASYRKAINQAIFTGPRALTIPVLINMLFGGTRRARTIPAIAVKCGINVLNLQHTVNSYNSAIADGRADEFLKSTGADGLLRDGPFRAIDVSIGNRLAFSLAITLGGLKVDEETGQVMRKDGSHIAHLYAAGRAAVGLCSATYISGMSLADAVFSARRAAHSLTKEVSVVSRHVKSVVSR